MFPVQWLESRFLMIVYYPPILGGILSLKYESILTGWFWKPFFVLLTFLLSLKKYLNVRVMLILPVFFDSDSFFDLLI